jgi:diguanylate cyclase (GGDEF)-like protein
MRIKTKLFDSRVARSVFGSFLLASLVPLLGFSYVAVSQVGGALERQVLERLSTLSRNYGQMTLDKLVTSGEALGDIDRIGASASREFAGMDAVAVIENGVERTLFGEWPGSRAGIDAAADQPSVAVVPGPSGAEIVISQRFGATTAFGRVSLEYLLRTNGLLDRGTEVCLFAATSPGAEPFYCSSPLPSSAVDTLLRHSHEPAETERLVWEADGEEWLMAHWQLFLPSRFHGEPWLVVVSQPRGIALAAVELLERGIPQIAALTLALIVILALAQIRRTLTPLDALLAGTKRIAAQDFGTPVKIGTHDEFADLGLAVNGMASQLGHQFRELRALADIDRLILDSTEIDPVLETVFARLAQLVPDARHVALLCDADDPKHGRLYAPSTTGALDMERMTLPQALRDWLASPPEPAQVAPSDLAAFGLSTPATLGMERAFIAPIAGSATAPGALLSAKNDGSELTEREMASLRELAARLAVAVAASKREAELFQRAHYDALTGLPNRELFHDRLHQAVAQAARDEHALGVLFIDLDSFKEVNDTLGHPCGDELLKETALRLAAVLRHADTVARLGGDEYAIVLPSVHGPLEVEAVAVKAIEALRRPFAIDGQEAFVNASVGIAMFPEDGRSATELLRKADMAMYDAKDAGKGCYRFFAEEMDRRIQERHSLHGDLRGALAAGEFFLAYQPQRTMRNGRYSSAEALLRWRHPQRGLVSPALFIPILEEAGLIAEVGMWVLRQALADCGEWRKAGLGLERVAVNVSARQLFDPRLVDDIAEALRTSGLEGSSLEIELTEASLVQDFHATNATLSQLRELGVTIAIDDFGTGYSSLAYLNELVFDVLKIDRSFVVNLPTPKAVAIVRAIVAVADTLDKEVVAEGIETESQYSQLASMGCDYGQGFLLSKPLTDAELRVFAAAEPTLGPVAADAPPPLRGAQLGQGG